MDRCRHTNTGFHEDNPSRFRCLDCGWRFVDLGNGEGYVMYGDRPISHGQPFYYDCNVPGCTIEGHHRG